MPSERDGQTTSQKQETAMSKPLSPKATLLIAAGLNVFGIAGLVFSLVSLGRSNPGTAVVAGMCAGCLAIGTWLQTVGKYEAAKADQAGSDATKSEQTTSHDA